MTTVVNIEYDACDVSIMRPSPLGNPFHIGIHGTRDEVCDLFEKYAKMKMREDPKYRELVRSLKGKRLGCCCKPKRCHGDTLARLASKV